MVLWMTFGPSLSSVPAVPSAAQCGSLYRPRCGHVEQEEKRGDVGLRALVHGLTPFPSQNEALGMFRTHTRQGSGRAHVRGWIVLVGVRRHFGHGTPRQSLQ